VLFAPYAVAGSSDFEGEMMESAEQRMSCVVERLAEKGVQAKAKIVYGRAADSILERAESTGVQLIVMGARGYSAFQRFPIGSVTQRVVRHAPCSTLVAGTDPVHSQFERG
jgi:nucleotide-binding universal stress UspA family protein